MNVTSFYKNALLISAYDDSGKMELLDRSEFELYADEMNWRVVSAANPRCEATGDDTRELTFDEYYKTDCVLHDIGEFIAHKRERKRKVRETTDKLMQPLTQILSTYTPQTLAP